MYIKELKSDAKIYKINKKEYTIKIAYHEKLNESRYEKLMESREFFPILNIKSFFAVKMKKSIQKIDEK